MHTGMEDEISCVFLKYSEKQVFQGGVNIHVE